MSDTTAARPRWLVEPGTPEYDAATSPWNAVAVQRPGRVAAVRDASEVAAALHLAAGEGWPVTAQATGHSAAATLGEQDLLLDTSRLTGVDVDPAARVARVGAGATWGDVQPRAFEHGLLGRAGSTGTVGCTGYHLGGGLGWLLRPHGWASASLRAVEYVDPAGRLRRAADDATDPLDVEAMWAFRGGGGVGVATSLELGLVPAADLWAGVLVWPAREDTLDAVAARWTEVVDGLGTQVTTALGIAHAPPDDPDLPSEVAGALVLRLLVCAPLGTPSVEEARRVLASLPTPAADTLGPADAARLSRLHADPPGPVPGLGDGHWLAAGAFDDAAAILSCVGLGDDFGFGELELRHTDGPPNDVPGAQVTSPAPLLLHATGPAGDEESTRATQERLDRVRRAVAGVEVGRRMAGFCDGRASVPDALDTVTRDRLLAVRQQVDPAGVVRAPALLAPVGVAGTG